VNKIHVVDGFPFLVAERLTLHLLRDDEFRLYFSRLGSRAPGEDLRNWHPQASQEVHGRDFACCGKVRRTTDWGGNANDNLQAVLECDEEDTIGRFAYLLHGLYLASVSMTCV